MTTQLIIFDNAFEEFIMERKLADNQDATTKETEKNVYSLVLNMHFLQITSLTLQFEF